MKTQAERQKAVRERRLAAGNQRRLNMWLSNEAYEALSELAHKQGITRMQALDRLLLTQSAPEDVSQSPLSHLLAEMPPPATSDEAVPEVILESPAAAPAAKPRAGQKKTGSSKPRAKKKAAPQVQIDLFAGIAPVAPPATVEQPLGIQGTFWDDL